MVQMAGFQIMVMFFGQPASTAFFRSTIAGILVFGLDYAYT